MAASKTVVPKEIDPKVASLILAGLVEEIRSGKVEVTVAEKIDYREETTFIVKFRAVKVAK
jgi:hypothetical protein